MGFQYARTPCFICHRSGADITVIIGPDSPPAKQFYEYLVDAHDSCMKKWERTGKMPSIAFPIKPVITFVRVG